MVYYHFAEKTGVNFHVADLIEVIRFQHPFMLAEDFYFSKLLLTFQLLLESSLLAGIWVLPLKQNEDSETKSGIYGPNPVGPGPNHDQNKNWRSVDP